MMLKILLQFYGVRDFSLLIIAFYDLLNKNNFIVK